MKNSDTIKELIDFLSGVITDLEMRKAIEKVGLAQREYLQAEASARLRKSIALARAIMQLDRETEVLKYRRASLKGILSTEADDKIQLLLDKLAQQRATYVHDKKVLIGKSVNAYIAEHQQDQINGIPLQPGDVLAVTRKGGLYQHYAVYVGERQIIHYAAENGDFSGKISIHEASFEEFQGDSTFVYVLDFPEESGLPIRRSEKLANSEEEEIFNHIRAQGYHLFSPEETIERARSRIGEERYSLPFNNCEHFAIWCKTNIKESHQVNKWLTKLYRVVKVSRNKRARLQSTC